MEIPEAIKVTTHLQNNLENIEPIQFLPKAIQIQIQRQIHFINPITDSQIKEL